MLLVVYLHQYQYTVVVVIVVVVVVVVVIVVVVAGVSSQKVDKLVNKLSPGSNVLQSTIGLKSAARLGCPYHLATRYSAEKHETINLSSNWREHGNYDWKIYTDKTFRTGDIVVGRRQLENSYTQVLLLKNFSSFYIT